MMAGAILCTKLDAGTNGDRMKIEEFRRLLKGAGFRNHFE